MLTAYPIQSHTRMKIDLIQQMPLRKAERDYLELLIRLDEENRVQKAIQLITKNLQIRTTNEIF